MWFQGGIRFKTKKKVMRAKAAFVVGRHILKDDEAPVDNRRASEGEEGIYYLQCAEWVVEPNGIALKASCKKGLVK